MLYHGSNEHLKNPLRPLISFSFSPSVALGFACRHMENPKYLYQFVTTTEETPCHVFGGGEQEVLVPCDNLLVDEVGVFRKLPIFLLEEPPQSVQPDHKARVFCVQMHTSV